MTLARHYHQQKDIEKAATYYNKALVEGEEIARVKECYLKDLYANDDGRKQMVSSDGTDERTVQNDGVGDGGGGGGSNTSLLGTGRSWFRRSWAKIFGERRDARPAFRRERRERTEERRVREAAEDQQARREVEQDLGIAATVDGGGPLKPGEGPTAPEEASASGVSEGSSAPGMIGTSPPADGVTVTTPRKKSSYEAKNPGRENGTTKRNALPPTVLHTGAGGEEDHGSESEGAGGDQVRVKTIQWLEALPVDWYLAQCNTGLGLAYADAEDFESAEKHLRRVVELKKRLGPRCEPSGREWERNKVAMLLRTV